MQGRPCSPQGLSPSVPAGDRHRPCDEEGRDDGATVLHAAAVFFGGSLLNPSLACHCFCLLGANRHRRFGQPSSSDVSDLLPQAENPCGVPLAGIFGNL
jgi:hypothetical protein